MKLCFGIDEHGNSGEYGPDRRTTRWRYGYQIDGEKPRLVGHTDEVGHSRSEARRAAKAALDRIREAGVMSVGVSAWVQCRTVETEVTYGEPDIEPT